MGLKCRPYRALFYYPMIPRPPLRYNLGCDIMALRALKM